MNVLKTELLRTVLVKSCEIPTLLSSYSFYVPGTRGKLSRVCWLQRAILVGSILPLLVQRHCFSLALSFLGGIASTDICCSKPNGSWSAFLISFARTEPQKKHIRSRFWHSRLYILYRSRFLLVRIIWNLLKSYFCFWEIPWFFTWWSRRWWGRLPRPLRLSDVKLGAPPLRHSTGPWGMAFQSIVIGI